MPDLMKRAILLAAIVAFGDSACTGQGQSETPRTWMTPEVLEALGFNDRELRLWQALAATSEDPEKVRSICQGLISEIDDEPDGQIDFPYVRALITLSGLESGDEAEAYARRAIDAAGKVAEPERGLAGFGARESLGKVFQKSQMWSQAEAAGESLIRYSESQFGKRSSETSDAWFHLADLYESAARNGDQKKAIEASRKALQSLAPVTDSLGKLKYHWGVRRLSRRFAKAGRHAEAEQLLRRHLPNCEVVQDQIQVELQIGESQIAQEHFIEAETTLMQTLGKTVSGSADEVEVVVAIGDLFSITGQYDKARQHLTKGLQLQRKIDETSDDQSLDFSPGQFQILHDLSDVCRKQKDYASAESYRQEIERLVVDDPETPERPLPIGLDAELLEHAAVLKALQAPEEAEAFRKRADAAFKAIRREVQKLSAEQKAKAETMLTEQRSKGLTLFRRKRYRAAAKQLQEVLLQSQILWDPSSEKVASIRLELADALEKAGAAEEAAVYRKWANQKSPRQ